jgi:hypothetical protein
MTFLIRKGFRVHCNGKERENGFNSSYLSLPVTQKIELEKEHGTTKFKTNIIFEV